MLKKLLLATLCICVTLLFGGLSHVNVVSAQSSFCNTHTDSQACQIQEEYLTSHVNSTVSSTPPAGSLPVPAYLNSTSMQFVTPATSPSSGSGVGSGSPGPEYSQVSSYPYVGAQGYQTSNQYVGTLESADTWVVYYGSSSDLGGNTLSGGLNIHTSDSNYSVDYLLEFYAYVTPSGYTNVAYAIYSACAGVGFDCGPQYNCNSSTNCPEADMLLSSNSWSEIGGINDPIQVYIYWNTNYGFTFDYKDLNNNNYAWTVGTYYPTGSENTMDHTLYLGDIGCGGGTLNCPPDGYAYAYQIGFSLTGIPENYNWDMEAYNSQYSLTSSPNTQVYVDHAAIIPWSLNGNPNGEYSYWKERWVVSYDPAGVTTVGAGSFSYNYVEIYYGSLPQSGEQLW